MDTPVEFRKGTYCYSALAKNLKYLGLPNPREWQPSDADWKLPANWKQIILDGMKERLEKYRSFRCSWISACAAAPAPTSAISIIGSRRSEEHAGAARRAAALRLPPLFHRRRASCSAGWPAPAT